MEAVAPTEALVVHIDQKYKYTDRRYSLYGTCVVEAGMHKGEYTVANGSNRVYRPTEVGIVGDRGEAERFAKNLLRHVNKDCYGGFVKTDVLTGYAAASTITLSNERVPSWDGTVFIDHIRNDYGLGNSKIFFRRPLEGYS